MRICVILVRISIQYNQEVHIKYRMHSHLIKVKHYIENSQKLFKVTKVYVGNLLFYVCIGERVKVINDDILFIIGESWISYDRQMLLKQPYIKPVKNLLKIIPLQLIQPYIQQQHQMSIQYLYQQPNKKIEASNQYHQIKSKKILKDVKFKFKSSDIRDQLIDIIVSFRENQKTKTITEQDFKKSLYYIKECQDRQKINRNYEAFREEYKKIQNINHQLSKKLQQMQLKSMEKDKQSIKHLQQSRRNALEVNQLKQQLKKRQQEKELMLVKQQQNLEKNQANIQQIQSLKKEVSEKSDKYKDLQSISSEKYKEYEIRINQLNQQKNAEIEKKEQFFNKIQQMQTHINELKQTKQKLQVQILNLKELNQSLLKSHNSNQKNIMDHRQIIASKDQQILKISSQLDRNNHKLSKIEEERNEYQLKCIFRSRIFDNYFRHAEYLKNALQQFKRRSIIGSKLLFTYDPLNKTNFHQYIDHHPNLLIIIKTSLNSFIAGFSQSPFDNKKQAQQSGFISSITNQKVYVLQKGKKSISYDEYFIIFGNSEIRIKSQELKLFSNFGISNGFYPANQDKLEIFLSCSQKEVDIQEYEVYRIDFQM